VVDQESAFLAEAGHHVQRFERLSDDIAGFPWSQRALVPARVVWSPRAARDLERVIERFAPDVVHVHNLFPLLSPSVMRTCLRRAVPVVATMHNFRLICSNGALFRSGQVCHECVGSYPLPAIRHGCYRGSALATVPLAVGSLWNERAWRTLPSAYIFISESQRSEFSSAGLPASRCFVKGNCVLPGPPKGRTENLVVYIGRLNEEKGIPLLMRAWDRYAEQRDRPGLRLALAGSGPLLPSVSAWAADRPSVDCLGLQSREQCNALLARARAAIVPSQWPEAFGLVVAEAMAAGTAPIATAHGSFPELISDGDDGVLFPPGDAAALAAVLGNVDESPDWFDALGVKARGTYESRFRPETSVRRLEEIYRFAIERPVWLDRDRPTDPSLGPASRGRPLGGVSSRDIGSENLGSEGAASASTARVAFRSRR
jgi:glycosyltransferase involved in cell wall biosynthesis